MQETIRQNRLDPDRNLSRYAEIGDIFHFESSDYSGNVCFQNNEIEPGAQGKVAFGVAAARGQEAQQFDLDADIDEVSDVQNRRKEEEVLIPPRPSCLYYCYSCMRYVPWNKVETVIEEAR